MLTPLTPLDCIFFQALKKSAVSAKRCVCCWQPTLKQIVEDVFIGVDPAPVTFSSMSWNFIHDLCQRKIFSANVDVQD
jgi:hypothetical protein